MSILERGKTMWEKVEKVSRTPVEKAMSNVISIFTRHFSNGEATKADDLNDILTGNIEPERQYVTGLRTEAATSYTTNPVENVENPKPDILLPVRWNEASGVPITPTISGQESGIRRNDRKGMDSGVESLTGDHPIPTPMEGNEGDKPVEITTTNIDENGEKVITSHLINADNPNSISETLFKIGNNRLDSVPNLVYKSIINGETVLVVIDPTILETLGTDRDTMKEALKTENYLNPENKELQGYVIDLQRKIFTTLAAIELVPIKEDNKSVSVINLSNTTGNDIGFNSTALITNNSNGNSNGNIVVSIITIGGRYFGENPTDNNQTDNNQTDNEINKILHRVLRYLKIGLNEKAEAIFEGEEGLKSNLLILAPNKIIDLLVESNAVYDYVMNKIIQSGTIFTNLSPREQVDTVMNYAKNAFENPAIMFNAVIEVSRLYERYQVSYNDYIRNMEENPLFKVPENMDTAPVANEFFNSMGIKDLGIKITGVAVANDFLNKRILSMGIKDLGIEITGVDEDNLIATNFTLTTTLPDGQKLGIKFDPNVISANNGPAGPNGEISSGLGVTYTFDGTLKRKDGSIEDVDITISPEKVTWDASGKYYDRNTATTKELSPELVEQYNEATTVINPRDGVPDIIIGDKQKNVIISETPDGQPVDPDLDELIVINTTEGIDLAEWNLGDYDLGDVEIMNIRDLDPNNPTDTLTGEVVDPLLTLLDPKMKPLFNNRTIAIDDSSGSNTVVITGGGEGNQTTSQETSNPSPDEVLANNLANSNSQNNNTDPLTGDTTTNQGILPDRAKTSVVNFSDGEPDVLTGSADNQTTTIPYNTSGYYDKLKILLSSQGELSSQGDYTLVIPNGYPIRDNLTVMNTSGEKLTSSITTEASLFETTNGEAKLVIERDGGKNYYRNQNDDLFPNNSGLPNSL